MPGILFALLCDLNVSSNSTFGARTEKKVIMHLAIGLFPLKCLLLFFLLLLSQLDLCQSKPIPQYKNFQIEVSSQGYRLFGTETFRTNLKELLEHLQGQSLRTENLRFQLRRCCPPQPRGTARPHLITLTLQLGAVTAVKPVQLTATLNICLM